MTYLVPPWVQFSCRGLCRLPSPHSPRHCLTGLCSTVLSPSLIHVILCLNNLGDFPCKVALHKSPCKAFSLSPWIFPNCFHCSTTSPLSWSPSPLFPSTLPLIFCPHRICWATAFNDPHSPPSSFPQVHLHRAVWTPACLRPSQVVCVQLSPLLSLPN